MTFWLEPTQEIATQYFPGQYLPIEMVIEGEPVQRYYTLSSSPSRPGRLAISVKRIDGGRVSNWLQENLQIGTTLTAQHPTGHFHLDTTALQPLLLLSAGSGVTLCCLCCVIWRTITNSMM